MILRIKPEYVDVFITCPFTHRVVNTLFLDENLYIPYFHKGYDYMFQEVEEVEEVEIPKKKRK
jgi:hypothetical protein